MVKSKDQIRAWLRANRPNLCMVKSKQAKFVHG